MERPPCFDGIIHSINAIIGLFEAEKSEKKTVFLLTNRLNQDFLENFFSAIRQHGGWNVNPSVYMFRKCFSIYFITSFLKSSRYANCEKDTDQKLTIDFKTKVNSATVDKQCTTIPNNDLNFDSESSEYDPEDIMWSSKVGDEGLLENCANTYYAGYLVRKTLLKFYCEDCEKNLKSEDKNVLRDPRELFILQKNYGSNEKNYLITPREVVSNIVEKSMKIFIKYFAKYKHQELVFAKIKNKVFNKNCSWLGNPNDVCYQHRKFLLESLVLTNLFKFSIWEVSKLKALEETKKKNKKTPYYTKSRKLNNLLNN